MVAAGQFALAAGTACGGAGAAHPEHTACFPFDRAGAAVAAGAAFLAGSGVARLELVQLVAVAALYRRGIHAAAPPSCRAEKTAVAGAAKHPAAYPAAPDRDALSVRRIPAGKGRGSPYGKRTVSVRRRAAAGAGDTLPSGVVLCLPGAVVRAVRLLCPSGTAGVESTPCGNACHARRQKGTAGTAGLVWPADAARGDHPLGVASGGAVGDGVL